MSFTEILSKVGFDWRLAIFNLVSFLIIYALLKKYLFGPVAAFVEKRQKEINAGLEKSRAAETEKQMSEARAAELLSEARRQASEIVGKAHDEAKAESEKIKSKTKEEVDALVLSAKKQIVDEKDRSIAEAKNEIARLTVLLAEKYLGSSEKKDQKHAEKLLQELEGSLKK